MPAFPQAEKLIETAQKGVKLTTNERRHCISYLNATRPDVSRMALADLFKVSERQIGMDKLLLKRKKANVIKDEDAGLVLADIHICFERQVLDMEASKAKCKLGTMPYLNHCRAIFGTQLAKVRALQDLGYYPKSLGNLTIDKYEFKSIITSDDKRKIRPVNFDVNAVEFVDPKLIASAESALDTDFPEQPLPDGALDEVDASDEAELG